MDENLERTVKARRNLLLTTVIIWFVSFGGVDIENLSYLGTKVNLMGRPYSIIILIWSLYLYFFLRYYTYYYQFHRGKYEDMIKKIDTVKGLIYVKNKIKPLGVDFRLVESLRVEVSRNMWGFASGCVVKTSIVCNETMRKKMKEINRAIESSGFIEHISRFTYKERSKLIFRNIAWLEYVFPVYFSIGIGVYVSRPE